jgi:hypothetical protein
MSLKRKYGKKFKALWIPYYVTLLWSDLSSKLMFSGRRPENDENRFERPRLLETT